jgi:hypothetical protein
VNLRFKCLILVIVVFLNGCSSAAKGKRVDFWSDDYQQAVSRVYDLQHTTDGRVPVSGRRIKLEKLPFSETKAIVDESGEKIRDDKEGRCDLMRIYYFEPWLYIRNYVGKGLFWDKLMPPPAGEGYIRLFDTLDVEAEDAALLTAKINFDLINPALAEKQQSLGSSLYKFMFVYEHCTGELKSMPSFFEYKKAAGPSSLWEERAAEYRQGVDALIAHINKELQITKNSKKWGVTINSAQISKLKDGYYPITVFNLCKKVAGPDFRAASLLMEPKVSERQKNVEESIRNQYPTFNFETLRKESDQIVEGFREMLRYQSKQEASKVCFAYMIDYGLWD